MASFPNQMVLIIDPKEKTDGLNYYHKFNLHSFQIAMQNLKGDSFKLWCYLNLRPEGENFALGPKPCENYTGIKKDAYYKAKDTLIEKHYITQDEDGKWHFSELPIEVPLTAHDF